MPSRIPVPANKKGISSTSRRAPPPSLHRTVSGSRSFPMKRAPAPQLRPGCRRRTSSKCTTAFARRRRKKFPSFPNLRPLCLCQGQNRQNVLRPPDPFPKSNISCFHVRFNTEKCEKRHFSRQKCVFSRPVQVCCTSFTGENTSHAGFFPLFRGSRKPFCVFSLLSSPPVSPLRRHQSPTGSLFPKKKKSPLDFSQFRCILTDTFFVGQ